MLDRILRGDDDEWIGQRIGRVADRDLPLLHRFEQRALNFRRRAVDLVAENQVREDRTEASVECAAAGIENHRSRDIGR